MCRKLQGIESCGVCGPVYELRIYAAAEDRLGHLIKRFQNHPDRLFKKHRMEPIAYWLPTDGTVKKNLSPIKYTSAC